MANYPLASLYVGDLDVEVNEAMLYEKFSVAGTIVSIRVCRDMVTKRSLGYAYVNFANHVDAERALDTLNFEPINGKPCRIMWSQRDPNLRKSGSGNIFIKNLDKAIDNKALHDTFSAFGSILSCKVATDETGESRGFGYVHFDKREDAERAIEKVNGMLLNDKKVYVGIFVSRKDRMAAGQGQRVFNNLYIKGYNGDISDEELRPILEPFGTILSIKVLPQGYGFCSFRETDAALKAVAELHEKQIGPHGEKLYVQRAQRKRERDAELKRKFEQLKQQKRQESKGVNLYVKNLEDDVSDELFGIEFGKYGSITSAKIMRDEHERTKGFGFVCYTSPEEATKAQSEMNGKILVTKPLYVALAQRKEERRAHLTQQFVNRQMTSHMRGQANPQAMPSAAQMVPSVLFTQFNASTPRVFNPALRYPANAATSAMHRGSNVAATGGSAAPYANPTMLQQASQAGVINNRDQRRAVGRGTPPTHGQQPRSVNAQQPRAAQPHIYKPAPQHGRTSMGMNMMPPTAQIQTRPQTATEMPRLVNLNQLTSVDPKQQKQILGETFFPLIYRRYPQQAGKITGMLLELDTTELLFLLESEQQLNAKIEEAYDVLQKHTSNPSS